MIKCTIDKDTIILSHDHACLEHMADEIQILVETMIKEELFPSSSLSSADKTDKIITERNRLYDMLKERDIKA